MVEIVYNGKTVTVPVKDRGPFTPGREFDLSGAVAQALGFGGVQTIQYRIVR
jgi:rare lipoprotein A (peptidoglycan hydrolase)